MLNALVEKLRAAEGTEEELREALRQAASLLERCKPVLDHQDKERKHWRREFAGQALQGLLANPVVTNATAMDCDWLPRRALRLSNTLLATLEAYEHGKG